MMDAKRVSADGNVGASAPARDVRRLVRWLTIAAWAALAAGIALSFAGIEPFSEQNAGLMIGIGLLVGSVNIYIIRTAMHLVHARSSNSAGSRS